ncbi:MAG: isoleucine--tRNA ligase, partial [Spirochaetales bacterium]|nr:isoleucine--tRNA ligase [Spirochaetales bacterium]
LPHFGHFLPGTIKDIIPRYKTMRGFLVERRFGWDCHGLPVEYEMEKELGISGKNEIEAFGIAKFNEACRAIVLRYVAEWRRIVTRMGRWVDFDNDYKTMEPDYMESIWWVVKQLWEKGLLYEGFYILPYCPRCSTVLSNHELNLGGYRDVHDPAITVKFELAGEPSTFFLAWTTTPWTLPSNLGLALGGDITYVKVRDGAENYILAKERLPAYYKSPSDYSLEWEKPGSALTGLVYKPLFPYFADLGAKGAFKTLNGDFVSTEDGTGIVHIAPGFGEDDHRIMKDSGVPVVCPIDAECRFTEEVGDYKGLFVKEADKLIIKRLKDEGRVVRHEQYLHSYPHCWRCDSPLIYRAISSWFVNIAKIKDRMVSANQEIYWMPEHIKDGRFGKWLEGAREWAISRNRYWGNPIPVWVCDSCGAQECIGSREELAQKAGESPCDLHKHFVDTVTWKCSCGGLMRRVPEVLDCWFESGAMPYAQNHYPFENKERFEENFPADFICESLDQTRGWFYTLHILGTALFGKPAFLHNITSGLVLAEDGKKMSKSLRNYTDPMEVIGTYGAEALRLFLMRSAVVRAEETRFSDEGVRETLKTVIIPLWNSYSFFVTYANIDKASPSSAPQDAANPLDRWLLSEIERLAEEVTAEMERYDLLRAIEPIVEFIDSMNNWYIRRSRRRFWRSENDSDKAEAYQTLWYVLVQLSKIMAPIMPFISEAMYRNLREKGSPESVHHCDYPTPRPEKRDPHLELKMKTVRKAVSLGRALRSMHAIKTRQPLKALHLVTKNPQEKSILLEMEDIIREEINVKEVIFRDDEEDLVVYTAKPNYRVLGRSLGKDMKTAAQKIEALSMSEIASLLDGATLSLDIAGRALELTAGSVEVRRIEKENLKVLNEGSLTVGLDAEITGSLKAEGIIRDLVRGIQNMRKARGLEVTDRVEIFLAADDPELRSAIEDFAEYLLAETLGTNIRWEKHSEAETLDCGESPCLVWV